MNNNFQDLRDPVRDMRVITNGDIAESSFLEMVEEEIGPIKQFFSYYKCAIMEVETKFRVLNEQFSLNGESNPIEFIQSRMKSYSSIIHKLDSKGEVITL